MILSQPKPWEEIEGYLEDEEKIFVLGCGGCDAASGDGGEERVSSLSQKIQELGKEVTGNKVIEFLCNKSLVGMKLARFSSAIEYSDSLIVSCCGIGIQAVSKIIDKQVHPANDTISMGDFHGTWPSEETCKRCGECLLEYTGGICPLTMCIKGLLNGTCGGSYRGECEVEPDRPCGWELIYQRLKDIDRLDLLEKYNKPKTRKEYKFGVPVEERKSLYWAIEAEEEEE